MLGGPTLCHLTLGGPTSKRASVVPVTQLGSLLQVVVHNLPWSTTWQELKDAFAETGPIERADVILDAAGRSRWVLDIAGGSTAANLWRL